MATGAAGVVVVVFMLSNLIHSDSDAYRGMEVRQDCFYGAVITEVYR